MPGLDWTAPAGHVLRIETPRLVVRPYTLGDVEPLFRLVNDQRDSLLPWMPWARTEHRRVEDTARWVADQAWRGLHLDELPDPSVALVIEERATGEYVGGHGLHDIRPAVAQAETGYWLRADRRGRGYVTEATAHVISHLLRPQGAGGLGLRRVVVRVVGPNAASRRVLEKLGLPLEATLRDSEWLAGPGRVDMLHWGVGADEWDPSAHGMR